MESTLRLIPPLRVPFLGLVLGLPSGTPNGKVGVGFFSGADLKPEDMSFSGNKEKAGLRIKHPSQHVNLSC